VGHKSGQDGPPYHFGCLSGHTLHKHEGTNWELLEEHKLFNIHTLAFAFSYALVHAGAKSGTSAELSTGGGCLGELAGYTPGIGGSEEGDGKGANGYEVTGMTDGPSSVSALIPRVVSTEGGRGGLLLSEDELAGLDVDVTEVDNDRSGRVACGDDGPAWVDDKDEGNGKKDEDKVDGECAAEARAATRRARTGMVHMNVK
jgi:hypothetical protein